MIIELDRKRNVLYIGNNNEDIKKYQYIIVIYEVTHVTNLGEGWYDIYRGEEILGHITDVESVQEKW